eukprot:3139473-Alexandrium_andersonii.AAC.1
MVAAPHAPHCSPGGLPPPPRTRPTSASGVRRRCPLGRFRRSSSPPRELRGVQGVAAPQEGAGNAQGA